jgi:hypothetical protein
MRNVLLKCSRAIFNWPPAPATFAEKSAFITRKGKENGLKIFVETGTFHGEMIDAQRVHFQKFFSIELNEELFLAARAKFAHDPQVQLIQGDSGVKLREVADHLNEPALFWLDAHYSRGKTSGGGAEAPIIKELSCLIPRRFNDVILVDDARLFGLKSDYPKLEVIRKIAAKNWPQHDFTVESDIICILPPRESFNQ